jgi:monofunctional biosynthetic peptidoglycan transglycosylase
MRKFGRALAALLALGFAAGAYLYLSLPDVRPLRTGNPETTAFIELRLREARAKRQPPRRVQHWVPYARISTNLKRAVLVAEDSGFWQHEGIDFEQMKESMEANIERLEFARGGSTITQQLAKNLYLSPSKNPIRKVRELLIARRLEAELTKQRILELYLNVIEWGNGIYGAEAAARTYFGKSAADLAPSGAARRCNRQPARPDARTADRTTATPAADDHASYGGRDAAACGRRNAKCYPAGTRRRHRRSDPRRARTWCSDGTSGRGGTAATASAGPPVRAPALRLSH